MKISEVINSQIKGFWGTDFSNKENGTPVIKTNNMTYEGIIDYSDICFRNIKKETIGKNYLQKGDLLVEKSGGTKTHSVGYVNFFDGDNNTFVCNNFIVGLRPNNSIVDSKYLFYQLRFMYENGYFSDCYNKTTGIQNLKANRYLEKDIIVIDKNAQKSIATELDKIVEAINLKKKQILYFDELVKSRFIEMFGDPEVNPHNWEKVVLSEIITTINNGMTRRGNDDDGNIVLRLVELQEGCIDYSGVNRIKLKETEKTKFLLKENDFLFARVNGNPDYVGRCAVFTEKDEPIYHNDHIIRVHCDDGIFNGVFGSYLFNSDYGKSQIRQYISTSAGQFTINQTGISYVIVILPPIELQNEFAEFVKLIDKSKFVC